MISKIRDFFSQNLMQPAETVEGHKINPIAIATCALLLEMAHADARFSNVEEKAIITILREEFDLDKDIIEQVLELANQERIESLDLWQFTNLINENYTNPQKIKVVEMIWRVIYADGKVDKYEDYLIKKVSLLLKLSHSDMIEAKLKVKEESKNTD